MGVPAFFRWLSEKYPKILCDCVEKKMVTVNGISIPIDLNEGNPNGVEYDNLYIDMNGLIHPCSHPEDRPPPATEEEMFVAVTKYIDRLFAAIRPRRLLFLAIDGVAPRAKMNQQRSRRFRAVRETKQRDELLEEVKREMTELGLDLPPEKGKSWDANVITPGTEFMYKLSIYIRFYILEKMNKSIAWRNIKVILSDASEPGEGEHKIMKFIRAQRTQPGYDPNQRHILHGLDADLIMLALATHQIHFCILREKLFFNRSEPVVSQAQLLLDEKTKQQGGSLKHCADPNDEWIYSKALQILNIGILRDYLNNEFTILSHPSIQLPFSYDFERVIDDFVFMCFFVGNDFIPHLPSLDIRDGALDFLIECYKQNLPKLGNYLTNPGGEVNLQQVDIILSKVGEVEDAVFQLRKQTEDREVAYHKNRRKREGNNIQKLKRNDLGKVAGKEFDRMASEAGEKLMTLKERAVSSSSSGGGRGVTSNHQQQLLQQQRQEFQQHQQRGQIKQQQQEKKQSVESYQITEDSLKITFDEMKNKLLTTTTTNDTSNGITTSNGVSSSNGNDGDSNELMIDDDDLVDDTEVPPSIILPMISSSVLGASVEDTAAEVKRRIKEKLEQKTDINREVISDNVRLHEHGWKERYYGDSFKKDNIEAGGGRERLCQTYIEGLCWVLKYYYDGCPSWSWFYPFHYAPFASDLINIDHMTINFEESEPFTAIEQLLAVLPLESSHALPESCSWLMTDKESSIADIYDCNDVPLDPNGKAQEWQWVLLLPFIDATRINSAFDQCRDHLKEHDLEKNNIGNSLMYLHSSNLLGSSILSSQVDTNTTFNDLYQQSNINDDDHNKNEINFNTDIGNGICGTISLPSKFILSKLYGNVIPPNEPKEIYADKLIKDNQVISMNYKLPIESLHESKLLPGALRDPTILNPIDLQPRRPPRLNRGQYNMVDMAHRMNNNNPMIQQQHMMLNNNHFHHQGNHFHQPPPGSGNQFQHASNNQFNMNNINQMNRNFRQPTPAPPPPLRPPPQGNYNRGPPIAAIKFNTQGQQQVQGQGQISSYQQHQQLKLQAQQFQQAQQQAQQQQRASSGQSSYQQQQQQTRNNPERNKLGLYGAPRMAAEISFGSGNKSGSQSSSSSGGSGSDGGRIQTQRAPLQLGSQGLPKPKPKVSSVSIPVVAPVAELVPPVQQFTEYTGIVTATSTTKTTRSTRTSARGKTKAPPPPDDDALVSLSKRAKK